MATTGEWTRYELWQQADTGEWAPFTDQLESETAARELAHRIVMRDKRSVQVIRIHYAPTPLGSVMTREHMFTLTVTVTVEEVNAQ